MASCFNYYSLFLALAAVMGLFTLTGAAADNGAATNEASNAGGGGDEGNWKVGDCILAQFAMEIDLRTTKGSDNVTDTLYVPVTATADQDAGNCGNNSQTLVLSWSDAAKNDSSVALQRNLTIVFVKNETQSYYGMSRFFANFEYAKWTVNDTTTNTTTSYTSTVVIDSHELKNPMFHTPLDRSFLCADVGDMNFNTSLTYDKKFLPKDLGISTIKATKVQMDVFRVRDHAPAGFRTPMDCDFHPDDAVPIAVGVSLAAMVVAVLAVYMYGRRRNQQRGYESV